LSTSNFLLELQTSIVTLSISLVNCFFYLLSFEELKEFGVTISYTILLLIKLLWQFEELASSNPICSSSPIPTSIYLPI